jgi:hypothetical protein
MTGPRSRWTRIPRYPEHRQALKKKDKLEAKKERNKKSLRRKEENYPEETSLCFLGSGMLTFCLLASSAVSGRGQTLHFLPACVPGGGPWFNGAASTISSSGIADDGTAGKA